MKTSMSLLLIVIVAFGFVAGYMIATHTDIFGTSTVETYPNTTQLSTGNFVTIADNIGIELDSQAITELNIKIYGINGVSAYDVMQWYMNHHAQDGWIVYSTDDGSGPQYNAYQTAWTKNLDGRIILTVEGFIVTTLTGYDTIVATAYAPLTVFERYMRH